MIDKLKIQNFQSHENTILEFHKNINVIIGTSDSGKSSIIRALNWVINNKPSGEAFRRKNSDETRVDLYVDNNNISKIKTKSKNLYYLDLGNSNHQFCETLEFKAFGQSVPQEIKDVLNINSINIQQQHDSSFLLSNSSGEVARYLNKIVNLDIIDIALNNIKRKEKKIRSTIEFEKNQLKEQKEQKKQYDWIDDADEQINILLNLERNIDAKKIKLDLIHELLNNIKIANKNKKNYKRKIKHEKTINNLIRLNEEINKLYQRKNEIDNILVLINNCSEKIINYERKIKHEKTINNLIKLNEEINILTKKYNIIHSILFNFNLNQKQIISIKKRLNNMQKEFKKLFPKECPLCGK